MCYDNKWEQKVFFHIHCSTGAKNTNFEAELYIWISALPDKLHLHKLWTQPFSWFQYECYRKKFIIWILSKYLIYVGQFKCLSNIFKWIFSQKLAFPYNFNILTTFSKSPRFQISVKPSLNILPPLSFRISPQTTKPCIHISSGDLWPPVSYYVLV